MLGYVDGFVIPLPKDKIEAYRAMAQEASAVWKKFGALEFTECVGQEFSSEQCLSVHEGIGAKPDEAVVFSWIRYASKEDRDAINEKVMKDPKIAAMCQNGDMPFDPKRMLFSGFEIIVAE